MSSLFKVKIKFSQAHLFFPKVIITLLILMLIYMAIRYLPKKIQDYKNGKRFHFFAENYDKVKLFGTLILIVLYFWGMNFVGSFFPNMGYGFLITSIIFIFLLSLLFTGKASKKKLMAIILNSILTPAVAWFLFGYLFNILLP